MYNNNNSKKNNNITKSERNYHDVMIERKWLMNLLGFGTSRSVLYTIYIACIFVYLFGHMSLNIYGIILAYDRKYLILDALHMLLIYVFTIWHLSTRVLTDKNLMKMRNLIRSGFYSYEGENLLAEQVKIRDDVLGEIRKKSGNFNNLWLSSGAAITVLFPLIQMMTMPKEDYEKVIDIANPYLPAFFYMPFDTRNILGFGVAYVLALFIYAYTFGYGLIDNEFYISGILQLRAQLKILNYSIRHIQKRATLMYASWKKISRDISLDDVYTDTDFHKCLVKCIRSNIRHHQILLSFNKEFGKFGGSLLLLMFNIVAFVMAMNLYIIMQNSSLNVSIKAFMNLLTEQLYILYMCYFGEIVMDESSSLFESLYSIQWFYYNKKFNRALSVTMFSTMKPMKVKSLLLDLTASLETYGNFISTMYKILNVLRQSDTL